MLLFKTHFFASAFGHFQYLCFIDVIICNFHLFLPTFCIMLIWCVCSCYSFLLSHFRKQKTNKPKTSLLVKRKNNIALQRGLSGRRGPFWATILYSLFIFLLLLLIWEFNICTDTHTYFNKYLHLGMIKVSCYLFYQNTWSHSISLVTAPPLSIKLVGEKKARACTRPP